ncbi:hypothetical protein [Streptococcus dysgalactiae]|uniref:hypothetical protein n=1 Tax=Streptococcus dysgalactiae TaxID=1334 RepID=UPI003982EBDB
MIAANSNKEYIAGEQTVGSPIKLKSGTNGVFEIKGLVFAKDTINGEDGRREIAEGWLSKKITGVNDLDKNKYKIELTVEGSSYL